MIIRMGVDLPAPFGPRKPVTAPDRTVNVAPSTAVRRPYRFDTARASIIPVVLSPVVAAQGRRVPRPDRPSRGRSRREPVSARRRTGYAGGRTRPGVDRPAVRQLF